MTTTPAVVPFLSWTSYCGPLYEDPDPRFPVKVYGFESINRVHPGMQVVPPNGAVFGFVAQGVAHITDLDADPRRRRTAEVRAGEWFCTRNGASVDMSGDFGTRVLAVQRVGWLGVPQHGGPIDALGRLRYIDGCSDSLLVPPPLKGDACLNHLHFPPGIDQTRHTHPSLRAGIVAGGRGVCVTLKGGAEHETPLTPGTVFVIPTDAPHKFRTAGGSMDVIAFHPDSDHGPTHEEHPMVNRTLVGGVKIDNTSAAHAGAVFDPIIRPPAE